MKAAIVSMGGTSSKMTAEEMKKYFDTVDLIDIREVEITFSGEKATLLYKGKKMPKYDCIYAKSSFRYANILETLTVLIEKNSYTPIIASAFTVAHDKLLTQLGLQRHNIPMPKTFMAATTDAARSLLERISYPMIMKFPHGTHGKGVLFADSFISASSILDALSYLRQPFIMQEFVESGGEDIRAFVIGDKVVAAYKRKASVKDFRANLHAGGTGQAVLLDDDAKRIAVKAAKAIGAKICGVDLLIGHKGPVVIEVNVSPSVKGITQYSGVNVSEKIAKYLFDETAKMKNKKTEVTAEKIMSSIDHVDDNSDEKTLITTVDFRGPRILLPEVIGKAAGIKEDDQDYEFKAKKGEVTIKRFDVM